MTHRITIRQVRRADIRQLYVLFKKTLSSLSDTVYPASVIAEQSKLFSSVRELGHRLLQKQAVSFGAFSGTRLIGFFWGTAFPAGDFCGEWGGVAPRFRRRRVFSRLLKAVDDELGRRKLYKFWFYVSTKNRPAIECYLKNGYTIEGVHPNHFYGWDFLAFGKVITPKRWPQRLRLEQPKLRTVASAARRGDYQDGVRRSRHSERIDRRP